MDAAAVIVAEIATRAELLPRHTTCEEVDTIFHEQWDLNSVVIAVPDGALLVGRRAFFQAMTGRLGYGRTLFHRRPVEEVVPVQSLRFSADTQVEKAALEAADHIGRIGEDCLVDFGDGWGTVPVAALHHHLAEQFQRRAVVIENSESRFRSLVENSLDVILVLDREGRVLYHSRHTPGHPQTNVGDDAFGNLVPEDAAAVAAAFERLLAHPSHRPRDEFRVLNDDGGVTLFEYDAANLLDEPTVGGVVVNYRDITERRALEEQLRRLALHDPLTGLPNRTLLFERAGYALGRLGRVAGEVSILYVDLDGFKQVNDSLGHERGDRVLVEASARMESVLRRGDTLARFGGDEFVVLAEACAAVDAAVLADRIVRVFAKPLFIDGTEVDLTASVGFATTDEPASASALVKQADMAMYAAKLSGRNRTSRFSPTATDDAVRTRRLAGDLRLASTRGEFELQYQPIFSLHQGGMVGAEALLRWTHPALGAISPLEFIPIAEHDGLIDRIGRWVLREACAAFAEWRAGQVGPGWVSVNVSALQLDDVEFPGFVTATLDAHGLESGHLHLELTESAIAVAMPARLETLAELRRRGLSIALDDFGTGYSSLSSAGHLPLDVIKIDRSFIAGVDGVPEAAVMLRGIIELAHSLGCEVTAEGVERAQELHLLEQIGCDHVQGYLLGRPGPPDALAASFRRTR